MDLLETFGARDEVGVVALGEKLPDLVFGVVAALLGVACEKRVNGGGERRLSRRLALRPLSRAQGAAVYRRPDKPGSTIQSIMND
ncbi:MAG TPA: hypothetical protein VMV10_27910 [Pirellulales bacterium]|nr:hypothetical protein [Pirellulales bacterium]